MSNDDLKVRAFNRQMLRSAFQSLIWHVLLVRKRESGFKLKTLAEKLGIDKSYVSRSFSSPPNWTIDKLSDMADAVGVDLIVEARDRTTGKIYTPHGDATFAVTSTTFEAAARPPSTTSTQQPKTLTVVG